MIFVSGGITAALGVGFIVAHVLNPFLSSAYLSGRVGGIVIGVGMIIWGKRLEAKKDIEQMR